MFSKIMGDPKQNYLDLDFRKFDMSRVKSYPTILILGDNRSGKSTLIKDYLFYHQDIPVGTCISRDPIFEDVIPNIFRHDDDNLDIIEKFIYRQKHIRQLYWNYGDGNEKSIDCRAFLIMDHCRPDWQKDRNLRFLFLNGRSFQTTLLIDDQSALSGLSPTLRTNLDYIFIGPHHSPQDRRELYERYAGMIPFFQLFETILETLTQTFGFLVIDNLARSDKLEDQIFWYRADVSKHEDFQMCPEIAEKYIKQLDKKA